MKKLSPSLLSADFSNLKKDVEKVERAGAQYLHLDVMDGQFVPNLSFGMPVIKALRDKSSMVFDTHLMIVEPEKYLEAFEKAGADIVTVHIEACREKLSDIIKEIHKRNMKCGVALNPETDAKELLPYLSEIELVLVMTVHPGFGGQKLIKEALEKVPVFCQWRKEKGLCYEIEVDGGVDIENVSAVLEKGADIIVAGSAIFGAKDPQKAAEAFLEKTKEFC